MERNLEGFIDAKQIIQEAGMSTRPEFYSGRGATSSDLNDDILENVYRLIQQAHGAKGDEHAKQFAQMVADIPVLSATDFLLTLYKLELHDWKWDKNILGNENGIYVDGPTDAAKFAVGMATIGNVMFGSRSRERDQTEYIRRLFLNRHGIEPPKSSGYDIHPSLH